jgi:hypothetical protein
MLEKNAELRKDGRKYGDTMIKLVFIGKNMDKKQIFESWTTSNAYGRRFNALKAFSAQKHINTRGPHLLEDMVSSFCFQREYRVAPRTSEKFSVKPFSSFY